jgi:hypothetical protein
MMPWSEAVVLVVIVELRLVLTLIELWLDDRSADRG